jgi:hypothetical protein
LFVSQIYITNNPILWSKYLKAVNFVRANNITNKFRTVTEINRNKSKRNPAVFTSSEKCKSAFCKFQRIRRGPNSIDYIVCISCKFHRGRSVPVQ